MNYINKILIIATNCGLFIAFWFLLSVNASAAEKVEILKAAGITIAKNPSVIGETIASVIKNING